MKKESGGDNSLESPRSKLRPSVVLLLVTVIFLGIFLALKLPSLLQDLHHYLDTPERTTKLLLSNSTRFALMTDNLPEFSSHIRQVSRLPHIRGVVVLNREKQIVNGAWLGESLSKVEAIKRIMNESWEQWPVEGATGTIGHVFVAFEETWHSNIQERIAYVGGIFVGGFIFLAVLVSLDARNRLAKKILALNSATARIANREYSVRVPVRGNDALARLANNFNKMSKELGISTKKLRTSEERFELAVNGSNDAIWDWDIQSNQLYLSPRYGIILGYGTHEFPGMFNIWIRLIHPDDKPRVKKAIEENIHHKKPFNCEFRLKNKSGTWLWMLGRGDAVRDSAGTAIRMAGSFTNISEHKSTELALEKEKERAVVTLQSIAESVFTTDKKGLVTYMNTKAEELTGWSGCDAMHRPIGEVVNFLDEFGTSSITKSIKTVLTEKLVAIDLGQAELLSTLGNKHIVEHSIAPILGNDNQVTGGVIVIHDVTDSFKLMQQLTHQANHDPLTQLINRVGFEQRLSEALKSASDNGSVGHTICYLDLDQFKIINDTCGHSAGDELLRQVAALYQQHVRKGDTLARLGGDEFGLLLKLCPLDKALEITENLRQATESFRFSWEKKTFSIGVSIGVAPIDGSPGASAAAILSSVDQACYIAKSKGRNRIHIYQPGDDETSQWHEEMQWVPHIHRALDEDQFALYAQPIVSIDSTEDKCRHYEILLRMKSNSGKLIAPGTFLPAAERYGLMHTLDHWVVAKAIETILSAWACSPDFSTPTFGINISGAVLSDNSLLKYVKSALDNYGLPPDLLCFEITETVAIANFTHANRFVNELKEMGCRFALDDFGSGFASFSYLKTLPVDYLKIDGSFVRHLVDSKVDLTMVEVINQLGHVMGLKTIAEFVETQEILETLRKIGVDYAQGYHIGKPVPFHEVFCSDAKVPFDTAPVQLDQTLSVIYS